MFGFNTEKKACQSCGYKVTAPYPRTCPKCGTILDAIESAVEQPAERHGGTNGQDDYQAGYYRMQLAMRTGGLVGTTPEVLVERPEGEQDEMEDVMPVTQEPGAGHVEPVSLGDHGDYVKMMGAINLFTRAILFCSSKPHEFILELGANAHDIATSILGGQLERILFEPPRSMDDGREETRFEEALFATDGDVLYCIHGVFSKRPDVLLKGLLRVLKDVFKGKSVAKPTPLEREEIARKSPSIASYIVQEYRNITGTTLRRASVPTMETTATLHYIGLSYRSIGTVSLLLTPGGDHALPIKDMGFEGDTMDGTIKELVESLISAKIEAIAANTLAGTGVFPRYIITKVGFDAYRVIEFLQLENEYNLQLLASGNVAVLEAVIENTIIPAMAPLVSQHFTGQLTSHNAVKQALQERFITDNVFTLQQ